MTNILNLTRPDGKIVIVAIDAVVDWSEDIDRRGYTCVTMTNGKQVVKESVDTICKMWAKAHTT